MNSEEKKILIMFDMDHTILSENSDSVILKLLSDEVKRELELKQEVSDNWANFMQEVYLKMKEENIKIEQIKEIVENIKLNTGFIELFEFIKHHEKYFEPIIISGANTLFLKWVLDKNNLNDLFKFYISNPAIPCDKHIIKIKQFHEHDCDRCDQAQCKGVMVKEFLRMKKEYNVTYSNLLFIGDGSNDYCPSKLFNEQDYLFPRMEFPLYRMLYNKGYVNRLKCNVHSWKDGFAIIDVIKKLL
jgi:2,3-diketo-5-methylthio-1-phosphopentane phosphatase